MMLKAKYENITVRNVCTRSLVIIVYVSCVNCNVTMYVYILRNYICQITINNNTNS